MTFLNKLISHADNKDIRIYFSKKDKYFKTHSLGKLIIKLFYYNPIMRRNGCFLPLNAEIPKSTAFPHGFYGIFISQGAVIGENCTIFHQVTIGSNLLKNHKKYGSPQIGNNVYIGAGAKIIGGVKIGNNVRIGANAVVVTDIPDNSTVVLEKPKIIIHAEKRDNNFYTYDSK